MYNSNENRNSSSGSVNSSGYNSSHSRKGNYQAYTENNAKDSQFDMKAFINVKDGSNLTDISPVLTCIRTLSECDAIWDKSKSVRSLSLKELKNENNIPKEDGFYFAVSLRDGTCLFTSSSITDHLGFPKDMLRGQCFMNSVFQKDHITFANHLTQGLNACFIQDKQDESHLVVDSFFCRLRVYQDLKFGFALSDKIQYKPFKITLHINDLIVDDLCVENSSANLCVKATATVVSSAYTDPEEIPGMTSFSTRHTASCHFSHIDLSAIPYIGYLPQDMVGISVFDFYHKDDMPQLKDIYELVVKENGSSFRSKPYRFKVQNGCYIMLETEWSCFINPWSHKLEFVVGQHRVLKGPLDINIFNEREVTENISSDEILMKSQKIQKEIKAVLSQPMKNFAVTKSKIFSNKRKHDSFVYNCIDEGYVGNNKKGTSAKQDGIKDGSHLDSDSVIGHISPCREGIDSSVSSGTPPTVHHLRYQDNIERYFASQPKNYSDGSEEYNKNEKSSSGDGYQASSSGSGNGSGNTAKEPNTSKNYENKVQESSSDSSKCMSSITADDSGYGNNPNINHAASSNQMWNNSTDCVNNNAEKFSSCMTLTERSLSAHNRINHKHLKQHKSKSSIEHNVPAIKESSWFQTKDSSHSKRKKRLHNRNMTVSTPNQTATVSAHITPSWYQPPSISTTAADQNSTSTHVPQVSYSCVVPPNNCSGSTPPFYIPVLYMGSIPYYPPMSSMHPQTGNSCWPCPVSALPREVPAAPSFPFPVMAPCSHHSNIMPYPMFPFTSYNPFSGIPCGVQSSGVTATSPLITTTTTVASGTTPAFKNFSLSTNEPKRGSTNKMEELNNRKQDGKTEENECDMQVEDTLSSFTQSSSMKSAEKEDTDFELKKCHPGPPRSDKVELSSEIAYRFQMDLPDIDEILKKDLEKLKSMQQPELVNKQFQMFQNEFQSKNENKAQSKDDCTTESIMLGLITEDNINKELEYQEECLLQLMCDDS